jgi:hypothetical protein
LQDSMECNTDLSVHLPRNNRTSVPLAALAGARGFFFSKVSLLKYKVMRL